MNERADSTSSPATSHGGIDERADLLVVDAPLGKPDGEWGGYISIRGDDWERSRVRDTTRRARGEKRSAHPCNPNNERRVGGGRAMGGIAIDCREDPLQFVAIIRAAAGGGITNCNSW